MRLLIILAVFVLILIYWYLARENFNEENVDIETKHQEILDKIKDYDEETQRFKTETTKIKLTDIPKLQKDIALNEPQIDPARRSYESKIEGKKKQDLQNMSDNVSRCNNDKNKYLSDKIEIEKAIAKDNMELIRLSTHVIPVVEKQAKELEESAKAHEEQLKITKETEQKMLKDYHSRKQLATSC